MFFSNQSLARRRRGCDGRVCTSEGGERCRRRRRRAPSLRNEKKSALRLERNDGDEFYGIGRLRLLLLVLLTLKTMDRFPALALLTSSSYLLPPLPSSFKSSSTSSTETTSMCRINRTNHWPIRTAAIQRSSSPSSSQSFSPSSSEFPQQESHQDPEEECHDYYTDYAHDGEVTNFDRGEHGRRELGAVFSKAGQGTYIAEVYGNHGHSDEDEWEGHPNTGMATMDSDTGMVGFGGRVENSIRVGPRDPLHRHVVNDVNDNTASQQRRRHLRTVNEGIGSQEKSASLSSMRNEMMPNNGGDAAGNKERKSGRPRQEWGQRSGHSSSTFDLLSDTEGRLQRLMSTPPQNQRMTHNLDDHDPKAQDIIRGSSSSRGKLIHERRTPPPGISTRWTTSDTPSNAADDANHLGDRSTITSKTAFASRDGDGPASGSADAGLGNERPSDKLWRRDITSERIPRMKSSLPPKAGNVRTPLPPLNAAQSTKSAELNNIVVDDVDEFRNRFISPSKLSTTSDGSQPDALSPRSTQRRGRGIAPEEIQRVKSSISIVDVVESYGLPNFRRTGPGSAKACCPFHDDHDPSLSIDDSRGIYKCFACGAGGDVFNFIREYDFLGREGKGEKMGFVAAVERAAREFGDGEGLVPDWNPGGREFEGSSEERMEEMRERERKKNRMKEANTAAAAFYAKCLLTLPTAGKARAHLLSRNISPQSIRTFAIGYAPDVYYGDEAATAKRRIWGKGSLVEHLATDRGFTPDEIVEAGLAVRTKRKKYGGTATERGRGNRDQSSETSDEPGGVEDCDWSDDYAILMDRFRSRLIVPILDESGRNVIALGGRRLELAAAVDGNNDVNGEEREHDDVLNTEVKETAESPSSFMPAKYINSPESLVFEKKNILFNQHNAVLSMDETSRSRSEVTSSEKDQAATFDLPPAVVIVEGYFDAIALSNAGVRSVVASMGTALPLEQLRIAAKMGHVPGGQIILCMDCDDAGQNAVERLCSGNILSKIPELDPNRLYVATLPPLPGYVNDNDNGDGTDKGVNTVKDPADYVDVVGGGSKAGEMFQREVLDAAVLWDEWFVDRMLWRHYRNNGPNANQGGFADLCDEVSTFLATFPNPAERTMRAHRVSNRLAKMIVAEDGNDYGMGSSSSLGMLRVQLESDILNMSSRKASAREAVERRIERVDGFSGDASMMSRVERLSAGESSDGDDDQKMSKSALLALRGMGGNERDVVGRHWPGDSRTGSGRSPRAAARGIRSHNRHGWRPREEEEQHLPPHFCGFTFSHQSDRDWMGLSRDGKLKPSMHLGETRSPAEEEDKLRAETPLFDGPTSRKKRDDAVYFNSNQYLGGQYLTTRAIRAGYQLGNDRPLRGESIVGFTEKKLLENANPDQLILQAERRLLHALAKFPPARASMRTVYSTSIFGPSSLRWTSKEREWLFLCLTRSREIHPPLPMELLDEGTSAQIRCYLADRQDCPKNAFSTDVVGTNDDAISDRSGIAETAADGPEHNINISPTQNFNNDSEVIGIVCYEEEDGLDPFLTLSSAVDVQGRNKANNGNIKGLLDEYFIETEMFPLFTSSKIARETRAELTVQETVAVLLRATAMKRFSNAKTRLAKIISEIDRRNTAMDKRKTEGIEKEDDFYNDFCDEFDGVSSDELELLFQKVGNEVVEAQRSLYESERSADRVNSHLLDYSVTNGVQYKLSQAELDRLDRLLEEHVASLPEDNHRPNSPANDGMYMFGSDQFDNDIDPVFGGRTPSESFGQGMSYGKSKDD